MRKLTVGEGEQPKVTLAIDITGDRFGTSETTVEVTLINLETGKTTPATITKHDASKITATVELPVGKDPVKYEFRVKVGGQSAIPEAHLSDYSVVVKKEEPPKAKSTALQITYESFKSEEYPNLHSLLITNKSETPDQGFSSNPALMKVDIVPPGATNVTIQPGGNSYQMLVTYLASEKFEPKGVIVTVFDPASTLVNNQPKFFSTPFKEKAPKEDPNQPRIDEIAVTSIQRHSGYGTLRIKGSGFGDYQRPPISGERELLCCINRSSNPNIADEQEDRKSTKPGLKDTEVCAAVTCKCNEMAEWRRQIEERVNITLKPRNPDLRVERTQITYIDDKVIDVYFEFTRYSGYSVPFRLENATVSINKGGVKEFSTSDADSKFTAVLAGPQTYVAAKDIGAPRDPNLTAEFTILNQSDAEYLLGGGVGKNFIVISLTVTNHSKKKIAVPLGAIDAEVAWLYGESKNGKEFFDEGLPTIQPLTLGSVTGYFDAYQKSKGKAAKLFNILDGVATLATAMFPVIHELERPTGILRNGVVPGLRTAIGDLSSEQLARLTSLSWESLEEIPAQGSATKYVYLPRAEQVIGNAETKQAAASKIKVENDIEYRTRKQIIDVIGVEVSGFEMTESEKKPEATKEPTDGKEEKPPEKPQ